MAETQNPRKEGFNLEEKTCYCKTLEEIGQANGNLSIIVVDGKPKSDCGYCYKGQCDVSPYHFRCPYN
jgi:hypothetical protein